jgi:hypothetical protein
MAGLAVFGEFTAGRTHLTLTKTVDNTGGGTALATAWSQAQERLGALCRLYRPVTLPPSASTALSRTPRPATP